MHFRYTILYIIIATLLGGCKDDSLATGSNVLEEDEGIIVRLDTFDLKSSLQQTNNIISMPDSFMLGEIDNKYGDLKAEIVSQFACPIGYDYPEGTILDSVCLTLLYTSWIGDGNAPLAIRAYELDKKTLNYNATYYSDINIDNYCSEASRQIELFDNPPVLLPNSPDSIIEGVYMVDFKMTDEFAQKFFAIRNFNTQEDFCKIFKGLYITPVFGSSSILNISMLAVNVYFHFERNYIDPAGVAHKDTIYDNKAFYANNEVQQVNRFTVPNKDLTFQDLQKESDSINVIVAPAGIYTQIQFPMGEMKKEIEKKLNNKRAYVNKAQLKVNILYDQSKAESSKTRDDWGIPASNMLLLRDTLVTDNKYFKDKTILLTTDDAILSEIMTGKESDGTTYYYYSFDMSHLLTAKLRNSSEPDTLKMTMVPVEVEYTSTSSSSSSYAVSAIRQAQTYSTTVVPSANNPKTPLRLEVVYSGF